MDRRQRKTREAIFKAFIALLSERQYHQITVADIIERADVGRATFYAHFETKDFLLKELCEELFEHVIDTAMGRLSGTAPCVYGSAEDSVFLHLLRHLQENDRHILELLASDNNGLFLRYFKGELHKLVQSEYELHGKASPNGLPAEYVIHHIGSSFVETVSWWISRSCRETPEQIAAYFSAVIEPIM